MSAPLVVSPLNRSALWSVIVGVRVWAVNAAIGGVLLIAFVATPVSGGLSGLGPALLVGLSTRVLSLLLTLIALIVGFTLARRGLRSTRFSRERGRGLAIIGLAVAWINVASLLSGAVEPFGTVSMLAGSAG
jgi:hypothetical protein